MLDLYLDALVEIFLVFTVALVSMTVETLDAFVGAAVLGILFFVGLVDGFLGPDFLAFGGGSSGDAVTGTIAAGRCSFSQSISTWRIW